MFRRGQSTRKPRRLQLNRTFAAEALEPRLLLAFTPPVGGEAPNVFAVAQGTVPGPPVVEVLDTSAPPYVMPNGYAVLGFHVEATGAATLDPAAVTLSGVAVTNVVVRNDLPSSNGSLVLARVGPGLLNVSIGGEAATTGDYSIEVFLAGDETGNFKVDATDKVNIQGQLGTVPGAQESDSNLDGAITAFDYMQTIINNGVTVVVPSVGTAPTAVDDDPAGAAAFTVSSGGTLTVPDGATDIVERNDTVGTPAATISDFGGGSLGGSVTDNTAGTSVPTVGTGTLQVNANGSFTLVTDLAQSGLFTFDYRLDNGVGTSDATVTVDIQDDTPPSVTITSPTNGSTVAEGSSITIQANATDNIAVTQVEFFVNGGSIGVDNTAPYESPSFVVPASPSPLPLSAEASDAAGNTGTNAITVNILPPTDAMDDSYPGIIGNVGLDVTAGNGVLSNDVAATTVTEVNGVGANVGSPTATTNSGTVTVQSDGSFLYEPAAGNFTNDSFTYEANGADTATVTLQFGSDVIWFIDSTPSGAGNVGTLSDPFTTIAGYNVSAATANQEVYIAAGSYTGPLNLNNTSVVIGEGATGTTATLLGVTEPTDSRTLPSVGGSNPVITSSANGINLASGNTIRGLTIGNTTGTGLFGTSVGTATVSDVSINGTGAGVDITTGTLAMSFDEISSSNAAGIDLSGVSGDFDVTTGTINSGSSTAVSISGSPVDLGVTLTSVSASGAVNGININNTTGSFTITGDGGNTRNASGGTIANSTSHGIVLTDTEGFSATSLDLTSPGDSLAEHGLLATDIQGTNLIRAGRVTGIGHTSGDGIRIENTNTNLTLFEVNDTLFTGVSTGGNDGVFVNALGSSTMRIDVLNNSEFDSLRGDGVQVNSNNTSNVTVNLKNSEFNTDTGGADGALAGGTSRVTFIAGDTSTLTTVVEDNILDDTGTQFGLVPVSSDIGVLDLIANGASNLIARIRRNAIFGIDQEQGIRVVGDDNANSLDVIIDNNDIDNIESENAIFVYLRDATQLANISIINNDIGTGPDGGVGGGDNLPIAEHGIELRVQSRNTTNGGGTNPDTPIVANVLISGNDIVNSDSASEGIDLESESDSGDGSSATPAATLNATVTGNNLVNLSTGDEAEIDSEDGPASGAGESEICVDFTGNTLNAGGGTMVVDEDAGATLDVVQGSQAALAAANGIPTVNVTVSGAPNFGAAGSCTTPTHAGTPPLTAAGGEGPGAAATLTEAQLASVADAAVALITAELGGGEVVEIIDNGDEGFAATAGWTHKLNPSLAGFETDHHHAKGSSGSATWTFADLPAGDYLVSTTWTANTNRSTAAPFTILDGTTMVTQEIVNQTGVPQSDQVVGGTNFQDLATVSVGSGTLVVELSAAPGKTIADAVRIERMDTNPAVALLSQVTFQIGDLSEGVLGAPVSSSVIQIDADAAGYGWFVDSTPEDPSEFDAYVGGSQFQASGGEAASRMDLLTVVMHELGHVLGAGHGDEDSLMGETLEVGTRHLLALDAVFDELGEG